MIYIVGYTVVRETVGCVKQIAAVVIISPMEEDKMLSCSLDVIVIFLKSSWGSHDIAHRYGAREFTIHTIRA